MRGKEPAETEREGASRVMSILWWLELGANEGAEGV